MCSKVSRVISGLRQARDYFTLFKCTKKYIALKSMPVFEQKPRGHLLIKPDRYKKGKTEQAA